MMSTFSGTKLVRKSIRTLSFGTIICPIQHLLTLQYVHIDVFLNEAMAFLIVVSLAVESGLKKCCSCYPQSHFVKE